MSKHLLLLLLISSILNLEVGLRDSEKEAIELKISSQLEYDKENNYFKFFYDTSGDSYLFFYFYNDRPEIYVIDPHNNKTEINSIYGYLYAKLEYTGTYFFEMQCHHVFCELGGKFSIGIFGNHTEKIDLSQNYYYQLIDIYRVNKYFGSTRYKVSGLKEDKIIYFRNLGYNYDSYPYDPDNPSKPDRDTLNSLKIFEVSDITAGQTYKNLTIFEFKAEHEYIITIRCLKSYYDDYNAFSYSRFMFFAIIKSNIKRITGEEGSLCLMI